MLFIEDPCRLGPGFFMKRGVERAALRPGNHTPPCKCQSERSFPESLEPPWWARGSGGGVSGKMLTEDAWAAGAKLPSEQELGRQLGVGRSTVREALRVLGHLGIVQSGSGPGTSRVHPG